MHTRWRILGELTTISPLHVGSGTVTQHPDLMIPEGNSTIPCDVQAVVKDFEGKPCIPGTALKGVLRAWAERFFRDQQAPIERIFGDSSLENQFAEAGRAEFCTARIKNGSLQAATFAKYVPYWNSETLTGIASHVAINRTTGTANDGKLYYEEFVPEGVTFEVEIDATRLEQEDVKFLLAVLGLGSKHATHPWQFGAGGADGWGRMTWKLRKIMKCGSPQEHKTGMVGFACCAKDVTSEVAETPAPAASPWLPLGPAFLSVDLELVFSGPLLVNDKSREKKTNATAASENPLTATNFTALRKSNGDVWLPASSFRGVLRQRAEFLYRSLQGKAEGEKSTDSTETPITRIFGQTSHGSRLTVSEFEQQGECRFLKQDFVAIDRFTGGAADGAKFDATYADRPRVTSRLTLDLADLRPEDLALLAAALRDVCEGKAVFGFGSSKGYGEARGTVRLVEFKEVPRDWNIPDSFREGLLDDSGRAWLNQAIRLLSRGPIAIPLELAPRSSLTVAAPLPAKKPLPLVLKKGILVWKKNSKPPKRELAVPGEANPRQLNKPAEVHPALSQDKADSIPVDFELDNKGQAVRIRPAGEPWSTAVPAAAQAGGTQPPDARFAHPYYFLPASNREGAAFSGELGDHRPAGHDRYIPNLYSGTLRIRLTTKTPLLICDDSRAQVDAGTGHKTYPVLMDGDRPLLASSSLRGMLRAAYEGITNSRFGVFPGSEAANGEPARGHGRRLGFRLPARQGLKTVPVRIVDVHGTLQAEILPGSSSVQPNGTAAPGDPVFAAWCAFYGGWKPAGLSGLSHRDDVWAYLTPWHYDKGRTRFDFWNVEALQPGANGRPTAPPASPMRKVFGSARPSTDWGVPGWHHGYLCVTNQNMTGKHDERVFFASTPGTAPRIALEPWHRLQWRELIEDYHDQHEREIAEGKVRPPILTSGAWSRHVSIAPKQLSKSELELRPGDLCYAEVTQTRGVWGISALYPVMISRKLYEKSPLEITPPKLRPAVALAALSPADRVFGWVGQGEEAVASEEAPAYRSQVRVGRVECETTDAVDTFNPPRTLAILGQPKPQQGRFYLQESDGRPRGGDNSREAAGYQPANRVRGPKVYPHHQDFREENWRSFERSNQNRSVTGWVKEDVEFVFDLHITNLSSIELGALVWLLTLPPEHFLRLGLGKPLGFGSVKLQIDDDGARIATGAAWTEATLDWSATPKWVDVIPFGREFETSMKGTNANLLRAFLRAAGGFAGTAIHYPRLPGQAQGEHFKWFKSNEEGRKHALPVLHGDNVTLPREPSVPG